jgi:hypothetical protein
MALQVLLGIEMWRIVEMFSIVRQVEGEIVDDAMREGGIDIGKQILHEVQRARLQILHLLIV